MKRNTFYPERGNPLRTNWPLFLQRLLLIIKIDTPNLQNVRVMLTYQEKWCLPPATAATAATPRKILYLPLGLTAHARVQETPSLSLLSLAHPPLSDGRNGALRHTTRRGAVSFQSACVGGFLGYSWFLFSIEHKRIKIGHFSLYVRSLCS